MNATATARVPAEIKLQGDAILKSLGSSTTELINAAYMYVLKEHKLPEVNARNMRIITEEMIAEIENDLELISIQPTSEFAGLSYEELRDLTYEERYARFS